MENTQQDFSESTVPEIRRILEEAYAVAKKSLPKQTDLIMISVDRDGFACAAHQMDDERLVRVLRNISGNTLAGEMVEL